MRGKAVFFATSGLTWGEEIPGCLPTATIGSDEWKALRLLVIAGYRIVLFMPDRAASPCPVQALSQAAPERPPAQMEFELSSKAKPLLQAAYELRLDLTRSWMVGDTLNSIEVGRWIGCKTVLFTAGQERSWEMTERRWPDLIGGDVWEIACLIVLSDGSFVDGLSPTVEYDD